MWNPRLFVLLLCVGALGRASHRAALRELDGEFAGWAGFITFWLPLAIVIYLCLAMTLPYLARRLKRR